MKFNFFGLVALAATAAPRPASAQLCLGTASFVTAPVRVGLVGLFGSRYREYGANAAVGSHNSIFGGGGVLRVLSDDYNPALSVNANVGVQVPLAKGGLVQLCPIAEVEHQFGPKNIDGEGDDVAITDGSIGGAIGAVAFRSPSFALLPSIRVAYVHSRATFTGPALDPQTDQNDLGKLWITAGMAFKGVISVAPSVSVPFAVPTPVASYGLSVSLSLPAR